MSKSKLKGILQSAYTRGLQDEFTMIKKDLISIANVVEVYQIELAEERLKAMTIHLSNLKILLRAYLDE
mgnify:CR=1 FL=1